MIKLLLGGSPCTYWSISQQPKSRETTAEGAGWELFKNYLIAKEKFKPDYFLYENNKSAAANIKEQIQRELKTEIMYINSGLVSAQNRNRFYVFNWNAQQPKDRNILFNDIIESGIAFQEKAYTLTTRCGSGAIIYDTLGKHRHSMIAERATTETQKKEICYKVNNGEITIKGITYKISLPDGMYYFRKMTPVECERLQTMPDGYTKSVSNAQAYKMLGNGWTAEVIKHLLKSLNLPRNEKITVLSMYDGMGTGLYALKSLGYENIKYFAYEIDKYAIQVAKDNYPEIVECGDAFQVRNDDWSIGGQKCGQ